MTNILTKHKEMVEAYEAAQKIRQSTASTVLAYQELSRESLREINEDNMLSDSGRAVKRQELRQKLGEEFLKTAKKMKDDYQKQVIKAQVAAEVLLNEEPPKVDGVSLKTFERELRALKMDVMLATSADAAIKAVEEFATKQSSPYLARQLSAELPGIIGNVMDTAKGDPQAKLKLRSIADAVQKNSMMPEQHKAMQLADTLEGAATADLFLEGGEEIRALGNIIDNKYLNYVNRPDACPFMGEATETQ